MFDKNLDLLKRLLDEQLWTRGGYWRDFIFDSVALSQALEGDSPDQLMQQTQNLQYAYVPNMGQPWVLTRPSFLPVSISCSATDEFPIGPMSFPFSPSCFSLPSGLGFISANFQWFCLLCGLLNTFSLNHRMTAILENTKCGESHIWTKWLVVAELKLCVWHCHCLLCGHLDVVFVCGTSSVTLSLVCLAFSPPLLQIGQSLTDPAISH